MQAEVIRSRRKTLCVEIRNGQVIVRAPLWVSGAEISRFLEENSRGSGNIWPGQWRRKKL